MKVPSQPKMPSLESPSPPLAALNPSKTLQDSSPSSVRSQPLSMPSSATLMLVTLLVILTTFSSIRRSSKNLPIKDSNQSRHQSKSSRRSRKKIHPNHLKTKIKIKPKKPGKSSRQACGPTCGEPSSEGCRQLNANQLKKLKYGWKPSHPVMGSMRSGIPVKRSSAVKKLKVSQQLTNEVQRSTTKTRSLRRKKTTPGAEQRRRGKQQRLVIAAPDGRRHLATSDAQMHKSDAGRMPGTKPSTPSSSLPLSSPIFVFDIA